MLILERLRWRREVESRRRQRKIKEKELAKLRVQVSGHSSADKTPSLFVAVCRQKNKEWRRKRESQVNEAETENCSISSGNEDLERAIRYLKLENVSSVNLNLETRAGVSAVRGVAGGSHLPVRGDHHH